MLLGQLPQRCDDRSWLLLVVVLVFAVVVVWRWTTMAGDEDGRDGNFDCDAHLDGHGGKSQHQHVTVPAKSPSMSVPCSILMPFLVGLSNSH